MIVSRWILLRMRNVSDKICRENQNTHFMFRTFSRKLGLYEIMWKNTEPDRPQIIRGTRFACWITKATDTHSEYVILLAFPRQQWLRERALMLHYTYIACLVTIIIVNTNYVPPTPLSAGLSNTKQMFSQRYKRNLYVILKCTSGLNRPCHGSGG
jgi:hypothetical protein